MKQIRLGVFETNSSSTHSICICTKKEYYKFELGELKWDVWTDTLVDPNNLDMRRYCWIKSPEDVRESLLTREELEDRWRNLEQYEYEYKTPGGEEIVVFGAYGYDG